MSGRRIFAAYAALIGKRDVNRISITGPHTCADPIVCIKLDSCSVIITSETAVRYITNMAHGIFADQIRILLHGKSSDSMPIFIV